MKILSRAALTVGALVVVVAIVLTAKASFDVFGNMQPKNGLAAINPHPWIWGGAVLAVFGGFLVGLAVGLSKGNKPAVTPTV